MNGPDRAFLLRCLGGRLRALSILALSVILVGACQPGAATIPTRQGAGGTEAAAGGPRGTLKIAWALEPESLNPKFITGSGIADTMWPFNSYLTYYDFQGVSHPMIAERLPTQENHDWVVNADGTMLTTYHLRPNARWHDGTPLTARDFVFARQVYLDPELPVIYRRPEPTMASAEAKDDLTLVITWKEPYVRANELGYRELNPIPQHLLERKYETNKASFTAGEEWTTAFVGSGPFKVEKWTPGQGMIARANLDWFLGPPKLEMLDIRFIPDHAALLANLMAGEVDLVSSPGVRAPEAVVARDQWVAKGDGYLKTWATRLSFLEFQYREVPGWTSALADMRVRQALMHAIDRQAIVDTVGEGIGSKADAFVIPSDALFPEIDRAIRKYPLDPERSAALLAEAGWQRAGSANAVTGPGGKTLDIEVMASTGQGQEATIIANNWKGVGINSTLNILPPARERDREYRANFTGTELNGRSISVENFHFVSAQRPKPETGYVELNRGSFSDPEIDRLHKVALTSLDAQERKAATIAIPVRMSELAGYVPLHYQVEVFLAKNKVKGPIGNYGPQEGNTWNIFEWQVAPEA